MAELFEQLKRQLNETIKWDYSRGDNWDKGVKGFTIHNKSGNKVGSAKTKEGARRAIDSHDNKYGAAVHHARPVYEEVDLTEISPTNVAHFKLTPAFLIRILEYARETAKTDLSLHEITDHINRLQAMHPNCVIDSQNYNEIMNNISISKIKEEVDLDEVAPPGFEGTVKAMKKHKDITNPWALAWYMKKKGYKSHK